MLDRKKIGGLDEPRKLLINGLTGILLQWVGFLGSPTSILRKIGDYLPRASDGYIYTASIPNMCHSLGRGFRTLREAAGWGRIEEWEQVMQTRRDAEKVRAPQQEARLKANYKKAKAA